MISEFKSDNIFFKFIEAYAPTGFKGIDRNATLILELEEILKTNKQYIYVGDMINMEIKFTSKSCYKLIGIHPEELTPHNIFTSTHPDDLQRHSVTRARLIKLANDIFVCGEGSAVMSTNLRFRNLQGAYTNFLVQGYAWFCEKPINTVCCLFIKTDISWFGEIKHGHNSYLGQDLNFLRYPDEKLIMTGNIFSDREFEILKLIAKGLKSDQIAEELFLSVHTINTHRRRILKKTGCSTIAELIYDLKEKGAF